MNENISQLVGFDLGQKTNIKDQKFHMKYDIISFKPYSLPKEDVFYTK